jgi:lysophospholipase L1-like esterase
VSTNLARLIHAGAWIIAIGAFIAFVASFSELQRVRTRLGEVSRHHFHEDVRLFIIRAELADAMDRPIVVFGDSITEMARLPAEINGHPAVNAGIGGASIADFLKHAPDLLGPIKPWSVAVALGTNDSGSTDIRRNYVAFLKLLKTFTPRLLAVGIPPRDGDERINAEIRAAAESEGVAFLYQPLPDGTQIADRIHLNAAGYRIWTPALVEALSVVAGRN